MHSFKKVQLVIYSVTIGTLLSVPLAFVAAVATIIPWGFVMIWPGEYVTNPSGSVMLWAWLVLHAGIMLFLQSTPTLYEDGWGNRIGASVFGAKFRRISIVLGVATAAFAVASVRLSVQNPIMLIGVVGILHLMRSVGSIGYLSSGKAGKDKKWGIKVRGTCFYD